MGKNHITAWLLLTLAAFSSCEKIDIRWKYDRIKRMPEVQTIDISGIDLNSVVASGEILYDGGDQITEKGVCYSVTAQPDILDFKKIYYGNDNLFYLQIDSLNSNTTYYLRAYAKNSVGVAYGKEISFETQSLPVNSCNITSITTGTLYNMQTSAKPYFRPGDSYTINMLSNRFSFGQASNVSLYENESLIVSLGNWLVFNSNSRTFTIPDVSTASNCYNFRVTKATETYVSDPFTIVP